MASTYGVEPLKHLYRTEGADVAELKRVWSRAGLHPGLMPWAPGGGGRQAEWLNIGVPPPSTGERGRCWRPILLGGGGRCGHSCARSRLLVG